MRHRMLPVVAAAFGLAAASAPLLAQDDMAAPSMHAEAAADLAFSDIEVPGFLPGMQIATIHGDPSVADEPYTLRLLMPDGYRFPPHFHPRAENVTVLEGTFELAMGSSFEASELTTYGPGDYLFIAAENPHFGRVKGKTVLQLHGIGPFDISVVEGQGMTP